MALSKLYTVGDPHRPIVPTILTPEYETAKVLNNMISPYLPAKYQINSTDYFLHILRCSNATGMLFSQDVESLFTNVPIENTIDTTCRNVHQYQVLALLPFNEPTLRKHLRACTSRFRSNILME